MAAKKRASSRSRRSGLVGRAVTAGRKALREAESRVPPDVRRQLERSIRDGQKTLKTAIDQLQVQVRRTAKQADVEKALKRLEGLSKQVQQIARDAAARGGTTTGRAAKTTRRAKPAAKPSTRKAATTAKRTASARKPAASRRAAPAPSATPTRRAAPRRAPARRTPAPAPEPEQESLTEPDATGG
jgi:hypothetical protein